MTIFRLLFSSSPFPESELSEFSGSAVLLTANLLALFEEVSWVTASVNFLTYSIWHFECSRSWVPIEVRVFCKTFVFCKTTKNCLIAFNDIFGCKRIRVGKREVEKRRRGFSGIPAELIRYAGAVNFVIKLAYYKQRASNNAMLRQIVPSTDEIYQ